MRRLLLQQDLLIVKIVVGKQKTIKYLINYLRCGGRGPAIFLETLHFNSCQLNY